LAPCRSKQPLDITTPPVGIATTIAEIAKGIFQEMEEYMILWDDIIHNHRAKRVSTLAPGSTHRE
jgi:hypothetical protein